MPDLAQTLLLIVLAVTLPALFWALVRLLPPEDRAGAAAAQNPRLQALFDSLKRLGDLAMRSTEISSLQPYCTEVLEDACRLMAAPKASLMLYDQDRQALRIVAAKGIPEAVVQATTLAPGQGVAGRAFERGQRAFVAHPAQDPEFQHVPGVESFIAPLLTIPLLIQNTPVGVLNLHPPHDRLPLNDDDLRFMDVLAAQAAGAIETLQLYERLERCYVEMVETLARAVDSKDSYTHDHSERARHRARQVAAAMGLPESDIRQIQDAALLHDVGKIGIADSILLKPAQLTPEEYEEMKKHPAIGLRILEPIRRLAPVAKMVLAHQEWYDGGGYPQGLQGAEIPLGARIVAVIDAWDAMTSDRLYRKALPRERAIAELRKYAGTQFDPGVVEVFLKIVETDPDEKGLPRR